MGFFDAFSNKPQTNIVKSNKYTWDYAVSDSLIFIDGIFHTYLFNYSKYISFQLQQYFSECNNNVNDEERATILNNIEQFIINDIQSIHYEEDLQYQAIRDIVAVSLSCLFETIEIVKNIDGEKSQQYFSGFTLNQDHVVNTLTQEVTQIISRELNLYLRQYLTDLENVKRYAEFRKNNENKGFGNSMLTNFMGGVALTVNPLIGLGLLAKGAYDYYQNDQNETNQIEQFNSLKEKFFVSIDKLSECENTVSSNVASFIKEKIITAFNELGTAINKYCNDNNFSIDYICDAIYQNRISDNFNGDEAATFLYAVLMNYMLAQENLYPGTREFFQRELQRLS